MSETKRAKVGVVLLNFRSAEDILSRLEDLRTIDGPRIQVWVVDNDSGDDSSALLPPALQEGESWIEAPDNLGYAGGNNLGIREALAWGARYVLILNPDCRPDPGFLAPLLIAMESQVEAGIVCPLILHAREDAVQSLGGAFGLWTGSAKRRFLGADPDDPRVLDWTEVDFPHGACMLVRRECLEISGLLHETFFLYYEDVEFGLRARKEGWRTLAVPQSRVRHRDTTRERRNDPLVTFLGTRNQIWVERLHAGKVPFASFLLLSALARWPLAFSSKLLTGHVRAAFAVLKGVLHGVFGRGLKDRAHRSLPRRVLRRPMP